MIGAKLDGEAQRKKHISTRHPRQAATRAIFAPAKARRRKSSSERRRRGLTYRVHARDSSPITCCKG